MGSSLTIGRRKERPIGGLMEPASFVMFAIAMTHVCYKSVRCCANRQQRARSVGDRSGGGLIAMQARRAIGSTLLDRGLRPAKNFIKFVLAEPTGCFLMGL